MDKTDWVISIEQCYLEIFGAVGKVVDIPIAIIASSTSGSPPKLMKPEYQ
jgi:hypothetical protein